MITIYKATTSLADRVPILELRGKSTDTKPTDMICGYKVGNGSTFFEIDTGEVFVFDGEALSWVKI